MKVDELLQEIREDYLDDVATPHLWRQSTLTRLLDRAQTEAAMRQRLLVDSTTAAVCQITLVADQATYVLDPRVITVEQVRLGDTELVKRSFNELDRKEPAWRERTGEIDTYLQEGLNITVVPTPTASDDGETLYLRVWRLPLETLSAQDDVPEIPVQYHRDLIWFVVAEAFSLPDEDTQDVRRADSYMNRFDSVFGPRLGADVLAHMRRHGMTSYVGPKHAYAGRKTHSMSAERAFDYED